MQAAGLTPGVLPASTLLTVRDDRSHPLSQCWVSPAENCRIDEREDNDSQGNPWEEVKRRGLSWLHECPKRKTNRKHPQNGQDQMFHQRKLIWMVPPVVHGQGYIRDEVDQRHQDCAQCGNLPEEGHGRHSPTKDVEDDLATLSKALIINILANILTVRVNVDVKQRF